MKKFLKIFVVCIVCVGVLGACSKKEVSPLTLPRYLEEENNFKNEHKKLSIKDTHQ